MNTIKISQTKKLYMKHFAKNCIALEPPWGEVWVMLCIMFVALALGLLDFSEASNWVLGIGTFALILLTTSLCYLWWQRFTKK